VYLRSGMHKLNEVNYKEGLIMGTVQSIAMLPGVSRSGAIIVYGLLRNFEREVVAKFTFLLAVPTMCAATIYSVYKNREIFLANGSGANLINLSVGFITAFAVALLVVRYALPFIRKYSFTPFAWYRIVLGVILLVTIVYNS
jgi:undecaprenyl-diphosphatase